MGPAEEKPRPGSVFRRDILLDNTDPDERCDLLSLAQT